MATFVAEIATLGYIDPGSGSMLLQLLVAGLLGGAYTARQYFSHLAAIVVRPRSASTTK